MKRVSRETAVTLASITRFTALLGIILFSAQANAAFMVEAHNTGKANATNFAIIPGSGNATGATTSGPSDAVGTTATKSIFASNNTVAGVVDQYQFSYTPGADADNTPFAAGTVLGAKSGSPGDRNRASGLTGALTGLYNVYFTTLASTNVAAAGSNFTMTQDGAPIVLPMVNLNSGGTGPDTDPGGGFVGGAINAWELLGTVHLTAGSTYTITQTSNVDAFVSQRAHGVMWERTSPKYTFTPIDYLGATSTFANGIGPSGDVVGEYDDGGTTHAFIRTAAGAYSTFDRPGAVGYTSANGLNSSGQIVGTYSPDNLQTARAYRRTGNTYTDLVPAPGAPLTFGTYINEAGHAVGFSEDGFGTRTGFVFDGTTYTPLAWPGAADTEVFGINNFGTVVGDYIVGGVIHGFSYTGGVYTPLDFPGATTTVAQGVNDAGLVVGLYTDLGGDHAFVLEGGVYTTLDYPNASLTWGFAVNNGGQIAGYYEDGLGGGHGFLASPIAAADFNYDGGVDGGDLAAWSANVGLTTGVDKWKGDANLDGVVDGADLVMWQRQFKPTPAASPTSTGVPEPGPLALVGIGSFMLAVRQSKANNRK